MSDLRQSRLLIQVGKNLVENKMPESHFFQEIIERGGKVVSIVPEYGPQASKADYWIPVRAGLSDTALFLGIAKALIDRRLYDTDFLKRFTDFPLLVRLDTLQRLRADEVFAGYTPKLGSGAVSFTVHGMTAEQYAQIGDRVVMSEQGELVAITREDIGNRMSAAGSTPRSTSAAKSRSPTDRLLRLRRCFRCTAITSRTTTSTP